MTARYPPHWLVYLCLIAFCLAFWAVVACALTAVLT